MNPRDKRILDDLAQHMREKVGQNVEDFVSRCHVADLDHRDTMCELMMFFISLTTSFAASQFDISKSDLAEAVMAKFTIEQEIWKRRKRERSK